MTGQLSPLVKRGGFTLIGASSPDKFISRR
jgi:hypothetical protein